MSNTPQASPWTCEQCGEIIEPQFDACWKCATISETAPSKNERQPEKPHPIIEALVWLVRIHNLIIGALCLLIIPVTWLNDSRELFQYALIALIICIAIEVLLPFSDVMLFARILRLLNLAIAGGLTLGILLSRRLNMAALASIALMFSFCIEAFFSIVFSYGRPDSNPRLLPFITSAVAWCVAPACFVVGGVLLVLSSYALQTEGTSASVFCFLLAIPFVGAGLFFDHFKNRNKM